LTNQVIPLQITISSCTYYMFTHTQYWLVPGTDLNVIHNRTYMHSRPCGRLVDMSNKLIGKYRQHND